MAQTVTRGSDIGAEAPGDVDGIPAAAPGDVDGTDAADAATSAGPDR